MKALPKIKDKNPNTGTKLYFIIKYTKYNTIPPLVYSMLQNDNRYIITYFMCSDTVMLATG